MNFRFKPFGLYKASLEDDFDIFFSNLHRRRRWRRKGKMSRMVSYFFTKAYYKRKKDRWRTKKRIARQFLKFGYSFNKKSYSFNKKEEGTFGVLSFFSRVRPDYLQFGIDVSLTPDSYSKSKNYYTKTEKKNLFFDILKGSVEQIKDLKELPLNNTKKLKIVLENTKRLHQFLIVNNINNLPLVTGKRAVSSANIAVLASGGYKSLKPSGYKSLKPLQLTTKFFKSFPKTEFEHLSARWISFFERRRKIPAILPTSVAFFLNRSFLDFLNKFNKIHMRPFKPFFSDYVSPYRPGRQRTIKTPTNRWAFSFSDPSFISRSMFWGIVPTFWMDRRQPINRRNISLYSYSLFTKLRHKLWPDRYEDFYEFSWNWFAKDFKDGWRVKNVRSSFYKKFLFNGKFFYMRKDLHDFYLNNIDPIFFSSSSWRSPSKSILAFKHYPGRLMNVFNILVGDPEDSFIYITKDQKVKTINEEGEEVEVVNEVVTKVNRKRYRLWICNTLNHSWFSLRHLRKKNDLISRKRCFDRSLRYGFASSFLHLFRGQTTPKFPVFFFSGYGFSFFSFKNFSFICCFFPLVILVIFMFFFCNESRNLFFPSLKHYANSEFSWMFLKHSSYDENKKNLFDVNFYRELPLFVIENFLNWWNYFNFKIYEQEPEPLYYYLKRKNKEGAIDKVFIVNSLYGYWKFVENFFSIIYRGSLFDFLINNLKCLNVKDLKLFLYINIRRSDLRNLRLGNIKLKSYSLREINSMKFRRKIVKAPFLITVNKKDLRSLHLGKLKLKKFLLYRIRTLKFVKFNKQMHFFKTLSFKKIELKNDPLRKLNSLKFNIKTFELFWLWFLFKKEWSDIFLNKIFEALKSKNLRKIFLKDKFSLEALPKLLGNDLFLYLRDKKFILNFDFITSSVFFEGFYKFTLHESGFVFFDFLSIFQGSPLIKNLFYNMDSLEEVDFFFNYHIYQVDFLYKKLFNYFFSLDKDFYKFNMPYWSFHRDQFLHLFLKKPHSSMANLESTMDDNDIFYVLDSDYTLIFISFFFWIYIVGSFYIFFLYRFCGYGFLAKDAHLWGKNQKSRMVLQRFFYYFLSNFIFFCDYFDLIGFRDMDRVGWHLGKRFSGRRGDARHKYYPTLSMFEGAFVYSLELKKNSSRNSFFDYYFSFFYNVCFFDSCLFSFRFFSFFFYIIFFLFFFYKLIFFFKVYKSFKRFRVLSFRQLYFLKFYYWLKFNLRNSVFLWLWK